MSTRRTDGPLTVDELLAAARSSLDRVTPAAAIAAQQSGAVLVDIRSEAQRSRDGEIPGASRHPRNVLEWRIDPACEHRDPQIARRDVSVILICDSGFQSSLAAATVRRFGVDATDVIGGFQAWRAAGLPVDQGASGGGEASSPYAA
jgi:rhodanese-related sulfurtransferase